VNNVRKGGQVFVEFEIAPAAPVSHCSPVGDVEKLYVETIAVHSLRLARLLSHEQEVLGWRMPFETRSVEKVMRYESNVSRRLEKASEQLRQLQEARKAESNQNKDETTDEGFEVPEEPMPEEPWDGRGSSNLLRSLHIPCSFPC